MKEIFSGRLGHPAWAVLKEYRYAHRGYHDKPVIPENSLPAFERAIAHRFGAELDVHLLSDGTLAVMHDSDLMRCTGEKGNIEDLDAESLAALRLEGTDNKVPLFDQVLELFETAKLPLIIELKTAGGNYKALAEAVCKRLDSYTAPYCIESFDPRAIAAVRKLRPDTVRGLLIQDFLHEPGDLSRLQRVLVTRMLFAPLAKPDFVACRFCHRSLPANRRSLKKGIRGVSWTLQSMEELQTAEAEGLIPIFETFDPEQ